MNSKFKELSAARETFASRLHDEGVEVEKARVLDSLPQELAARHRSGDLHIHDLEAWNLVNNCSTPLAASVFSPNSLRARSEAGRIAELVDSDNTTVLLVSHSIDLVERICDRVCWIEKGKQRMLGPTDEVCEAYRNLGA